MPKFENVERKCYDCGAPYTWSARDQRFAHEMGFLPPKRCPACRELRKQRARAMRDAS
jgi:hypothetical protein